MAKYLFIRCWAIPTCYSGNDVFIYFNKSMMKQKSDADLDSIARQLWAIGDPVRLQILRILPSEPTCRHACNVSTIAERIGLSQPTTSHHLRVLRQAGIVANKKMCRDMIYWVCCEEADALIESLRELLPSGKPEGLVAFADLPVESL
jgi:DNA-binding transcriptional ArsR family regulator